MKAIIIAAGMGKRMRPLTASIPKCMLDFNGRTLLETHIETLRSCGISDICVIKGYKAEAINLPGIKYCLNDRYERNNILNSLFYAERELDNDAVVTYSDIYYRKNILERVMNSGHDIAIAVDLDWRASYVDRDGHPPEEAEKVRMSEGMKVLKIGKRIGAGGEGEGEFTGMMKLSKKGCDILRKRFHLSKKRFWDKPFHEADTFEKAYLTDMIQELVDNRIDVHCIAIKGGWREIDTLQDYENAKKALAIG